MERRNTAAENMDQLWTTTQDLTRSYKLAKLHSDPKSARHFLHYAVSLKKLLNVMCEDVNNVIGSSCYVELLSADKIDFSEHFMYERVLSQRDSDKDEQV